MSEEQVFGMPCRESQIAALQDKLAQSEAERERLTEQLITVLARESAATARHDAKLEQLETKLARERERNQWQQIMPDTQLTSDMEVGRWMGRKWVITRMEAKSEGWTYIHPNDFFTHYRALNPPALT